MLKRHGDFISIDEQGIITRVYVSASRHFRHANWATLQFNIQTFSQSTDITITMRSRVAFSGRNNTCSFDADVLSAYSQSSGTFSFESVACATPTNIKTYTPILVSLKMKDNFNDRAVCSVNRIHATRDLNVLCHSQSLKLATHRSCSTLAARRCESSIADGDTPAIVFW